MTIKVENLKVFLLCRYALDNSLYSSWTPGLAREIEVIEQCATDWSPPSDCGIVVTHEHYRWEETSTLRRLLDQATIPILILADGVLEFRNTWQNPTIPDAAIYQPLLAQKIACIGHASARMIEFWGNQGKTEVVGMPRLDHLLNDENVDSDEPGQGAFRLLVATATTPAFNDQQRETVLNSLRSLQQWLESKQELCGRKLQVEWRLTVGLDQDLGIAEVDSQSDGSLHQSIRRSDAVVTTPSTIWLESALLGKPTAVLDFHSVPQFVPAAWTIASEDHIENVLQELAAPPKAKMLFQKYVLQDQLACHSPAAARMCQLVEKMLQLGYSQRTNLQPVNMPPNMLDDLPLPDSSELVAQQCIADNGVFAIQGVAQLRSELSQAIHRLGTIPRELADKNNQIAQLQIALDESRRRVADVRSRLFKLRKILGIGKENQGEDVGG